MIFRFGRFELDEEAGELRHDGVAVEIQPKPLALLQLLLRERARVVGMDELFTALWPGVAVTPASLTRAVSNARRAIGDMHRGERIRSIARRGYRFVGDVHEIGRSPAAAPLSAAALPGVEVVAPPPPAAGGEPFVGRVDALARLAEAWQRAESGAGGVVLVTGAPGIGKTRLAEAFMAQVESRGAFAVVARCRDGEGVPAFWPWTQVLRRLRADEALRDVVDAASASSEEMQSLLPELGGARASRLKRDAKASEPDRFAFFDAVTRTIAAVSRRRPLLLVLEDAQWAGAPSLRLLEHLAFESERERLLVLATVRDTAREHGHPLDRTFALLRPHPRCAHVALEAFTRAEVAAFLERTLGRAAPADLTSELYGRTEGVPLFVREAIRWLAQRGDLRDAERAPRRGILLPDAALDLLRRALDALSPEAARLVSRAAVLGRQFPLPLLASLADAPRDAAIDQLDEATRAGVVEPAPDDAASWRFAHALFEEVAYERLAPGERARLHHRAAQLLERRYSGELDRVISELAHHHHRGLAVGDPERAYACAARAADRAAAVLAWEQAAAHHEQALRALDHTETADPARRLDTLLALGEALRRSGDRRRRVTVFDEALALAREQGKPLDLARAAIGRCDLAEWAPRDDVARTCVGEAMAALGDLRCVERARLSSRLAYVAIFDVDGTAQPLARQAVAQAEEAGDDAALMEASYMLLYSLAGPDGLEERVRIAVEMAEAAARGAPRELALIALCDGGSDQLALNDAAGARALRARASEIAGDDPSPGIAWNLRVYDTGLALLEGRFAHAARLSAEALALGRRVSHPFARGCHWLQEAERAWDLGDAATAERFLLPILANERGPRHWFQALHARITLAQGRTDEARARFEEFVAEGFERVPRHIRWSNSMIELSLLCAELGDAERARALIPLLTPSEHQHGTAGVPICYGGPVSRALARLYETLGQTDEALALYENAHEAAAAVGARPMRARILVEWGGALRRRGSARRAVERIEEGVRLAEEMGMAGVVAQARDLLGRA